MFRIFSLVFLLFCQTALTDGIKTRPATDYKSVQNFIKNMVDKHQFKQQDLEKIFSKIYFKVQSKTQIPSKKRLAKKPILWQRYQQIFLTNTRIKNGIKFWQQHQKILKRAELKFNIPAHIIVAILGIETNYGLNKGKHPTLATLAKKAFGGYRRAKFYKKELEHFLLLTRTHNLTPLSILGSHAGAMGYAQFISSSYRHYAIDFDGDAKIDLFNSPADAIGSVANYFARHRWQKNGLITYRLIADKQAKKFAYQKPIRPKTTLKTWQSRHIDIPSDITLEKRAEIIELNNEKTKEYWLSFDNFYILTRYNHSNLYAMATYQLSEILLARMQIL